MLSLPPFFLASRTEAKADVSFIPFFPFFFSCLLGQWFSRKLKKRVQDYLPFSFCLREMKVKEATPPPSFFSLDVGCLLPKIFSLHDAYVVPLFFPPPSR